MSTPWLLERVKVDCFFSPKSAGLGGGSELRGHVQYIFNIFWRPPLYVFEKEKIHHTHHIHFWNWAHAPHLHIHFNQRRWTFRKKRLNVSILSTLRQTITTGGDTNTRTKMQKFTTRDWRSLFALYWTIKFFKEQ